MTLDDWLNTVALVVLFLGMVVGMMALNARTADKLNKVDRFCRVCGAATVHHQKISTYDPDTGEAHWVGWQACPTSESHYYQ